MKIFNLYETANVKSEDFGLKRYINFDARIIPRSRGRFRGKVGRAKINVVERLMNKLSVPGHRGKKHKFITRVSGKFTQQLNVILRTFQIIENKTKENPIQILIRAIEKAAPRDEITTIEYGGARYPQAVDISPLRRLNIALRNIVHGAFDKAFNKKKKLYEALADELIAASQGTNESYAFSKKIETEKQADAAR